MNKYKYLQKYTLIALWSNPVPAGPSDDFIVILSGWEQSVISRYEEMSEW